MKASQLGQRRGMLIRSPRVQPLSPFLCSHGLCGQLLRRPLHGLFWRRRRQSWRKRSQDWRQNIYKMFLPL